MVVVSNTADLWQFWHNSVKNYGQPLGLSYVSVVGRVILIAQFIGAGATSAEIWDKPHLRFLPQLCSAVMQQESAADAIQWKSEISAIHFLLVYI